MNSFLKKLIFGLLLVPYLSVYSQKSSLNSDLWIASNSGDTVKIKELLAKGANINNNTGFNKTSPLIGAIGGGTKNVETVKLLLNRGADVNYKDSEKNTPLFWAVLTGNIEVVKLLILKGANLNVSNKYEMTPLLSAFKFSAPEYAKIIELLINSGADLNVSTNGVTPLFIAVGKGMSETAKLIINKGADVNAKNNEGTTVLMMVLIGGGDLTLKQTGSKPREVDIELINLLLNKGANVNAKTNEGLTPLFFAVSLNPTIVKLLINKGADINSKTKNGVTVLGYIKKSGNPEIIKLLEESGAKE